MEDATWLDVVIKRLRFFTRPLPLASTVGVLLLGVFVWDYLRHPEWFGAFEDDAVGPSEEADLSGLTPEEQAAAAGLDSLTVLMNELGVEPGNNPRIQALPEGDITNQSSFLNEVLALSQGNNSGSSIATSPFSDYLQQYQFGRNSRSTESTASNTGSQFSGISFNSFGRSSATERRPINPLAEALQNQAGLAGAVSTQSDSQLANELRSLSSSAQQTATTTGEGENATRENGQFNLPPGEFNSQITTIPGVDFPVLPTQPQMSPPPGTTGYTAPASLNLIPPLPGTSTSTIPGSTLATPTSGFPGTASGTGVPNLNSPNVDVSNGFTPYTPVGGSTATPTVAPPPPPFTAPRAPGVYTGGGYINTFSNPSGSSSSNPSGN
ncbi:hypothetical protein [Leptolyngbya iicbica]|uniref:Uncharacterized protein n=2 Tax=Cyanophyceae TaxID=3028117 RepID=A0A4Q7E6N5_9CYAN|nr:hypothetical protein [Leptolyngbya sp. LK]RZM77921.1 hypothetical protein DYY88_15315 [Leptolyngbya sp. LK]